MVYPTKNQILETLNNAHKILAISIKLGVLDPYTPEQLQLVPKRLSEEFRSHGVNFFEIVYRIAERVNLENENTILDFYWVTCYYPAKTPIEVLPKLQPAIQDAKEWWIENYDRRRSC
jgi:hypothetical protein